MAKFTVEIDMGNAAFEDDPLYEVRRILKTLVVGDNGPRDGNEHGTIRDSNGNTVGAWTVTQ